MILRNRRGKLLAWPLGTLGGFPLDTCETGH